MLTASVTTGGVTVKVRLWDSPPQAADIVTVVEEPTVIVVTVNDALVDPAAIVTLAGVPATPVLLLVRLTMIPPAGAGLLRATIP